MPGFFLRCLWFVPLVLYAAAGQASDVSLSGSATVVIGGGDVVISIGKPRGQAYRLQRGHIIGHGHHVKRRSPGYKKKAGRPNGYRADARVAEPRTNRIRRNYVRHYSGSARRIYRHSSSPGLLHRKRHFGVKLR